MYWSTFEGMSEEELKSAAHDIISWLQSAVGDVAYNNVGCDIGFDKVEYGSPKVEAKADDVYDDPQVMRELIGDNTPVLDHSYEAFAVLYYLHEIGHGAIKKACEGLAKDWC